MNKVHEIFPLIVYQGSVDSHNYMKKHIDVLREYWFNGYENESPEYSGRIFAHEKDYCKPFFKDLTTNIDNSQAVWAANGSNKPGEDRLVGYIAKEF